MSRRIVKRTRWEAPCTAIRDSRVSVEPNEEHSLSGHAYTVYLDDIAIGIVGSSVTRSHRPLKRGSQLIRYTGGKTTRWSAMTLTGDRLVSRQDRRQDAIITLVIWHVNKEAINA